MKIHASWRCVQAFSRNDLLVVLIVIGLLTALLLLPNRILLLTTNDAVRWSQGMHKNQGNVAMADGSVQGFGNSHLRMALANTGMVTNRLAMP